MKHGPTLIDTLYRATFHNEPLFGFKSNADLRERLVNARRFVLDERMSDFLGELATRAFLPSRGVGREVNSAVMNRQVEALRVSAIAPHKITWIEYHLRVTKARSQELLGRPYIPEEAPEREGWLIEQHPQLDTALTMHLFTSVSNPSEQDSKGYMLWAFPVMYTWTIDDSQTPWRSMLAPGGTPDAGLATGILSYKTPSVSIAASPMMYNPTEYGWEATKNLIREWVGVVRHAWALLATMNDLPVLASDVRQSKGFVARGRYRRFLNHTTLTINIPAKRQTKVARDLIALVRRRGHQVRAHWRDDWRNPPSKRCPAFIETGVHAWTTEQRCEVCGGHRLRIHEHQRGDASLGFVTHDYDVTHEPV